MIYLFGSMHLDPNETRELKQILSKINATGGAIAIELETNDQTLAALEHFRNLKRAEVTKILEYHFGKRRIISTSNFLGLVPKYKNITKMVAIEPRPSKKMAKLDKDLTDAYNAVFDYIKGHKSKVGKRELADNALRRYHVYSKRAAVQCMFREKTMLKVIEKLEREDPSIGILVYCGYFHSAQLKAMLKKRGIGFVSRKSRCTDILEWRAIKIANMVLSTPYKKLSAAQRLALATELIFDYKVWAKPRNISIKRYYQIGERLRKNISLRNYEKEISKN